MATSTPGFPRSKRQESVSDSYVDETMEMPPSRFFGGVFIPDYYAKSDFRNRHLVKPVPEGRKALLAMPLSASTEEG